MARKQTIKINLYQVISRAVSEGLAYGVRRAFKYSDTPTPEALTESMENEVMNSLYEVIKFGD